ncbi:MAG: hypothetical protein Q9190_005263, partial [Brigantiaea leucoxantha]
TENGEDDSVVAAAAAAAAAADADEVVRADVKRKWTSYVWDTLDKSPAERQFLFKLDAALLTFASLGAFFCFFVFFVLRHIGGIALVDRLVMVGYFIKYLDQANVNNAFVSGM